MENSKNGTEAKQGLLQCLPDAFETTSINKAFKLEFQRQQRGT